MEQPQRKQKLNLKMAANKGNAKEGSKTRAKKVDWENQSSKSKNEETRDCEPKQPYELKKNKVLTIRGRKALAKRNKYREDCQQFDQ